MTPRLWIWWENLRSSYWFVPALMLVGAVGLSFAAVEIDRLLSDRALSEVTFVYAGGPAGARAVLSTIAGSTITVAGVVFSITIVALSMASSQFGPRLLRTFMRDATNQAVLGVFVSTFLYCLLVLRTVRGIEGKHHVPHIAVTLALALAVLNLAMLIYFIHHISVSIQAMTVVHAVGRDLRGSIDRLFPEKLGEGEATPEAHPLPDFEAEGRAVTVGHGGYLQGVDGEVLMGLAHKQDLVLRLDHRPGHFVVEGATLCLAWPAERADGETTSAIRQAFVVGAERTATQDVEYVVDQLVEVAVRALSPGINDPFTAIACLDRLGEGLAMLAGRHLPAPHRHDEAGRLRVVAPVLSFAGIADSAFNPIRQYGGDSVAVTLRLLETLATVARHARRAEDRKALRAHAEAIAAQGRDWVAKDQRDFEERIEKAREALAKA